MMSMMLEATPLSPDHIDQWVLLPTSKRQGARALVAYVYVDCGQLVARPAVLVSEDLEPIERRDTTLPAHTRTEAWDTEPDDVLSDPHQLAQTLGMLPESARLALGLPERPLSAPEPYLSPPDRDRVCAQVHIDAGLALPAATWSALAKRWPTNPDVYIELAHCMRTSPDHEDQAEANFRKAVELSGGEPYFTSQLATFLANDEQTEEAIALWEEARAKLIARLAEDDPGGDEWLLGAIEVELGRTFLDLGREDEAMALFSKWRTHPQHGPAIEEALYWAFPTTDASPDDSATPWRDDPGLAGRFVPHYPDDLQVLVHDGGPKLTDRNPELVYARVLGVDDDHYIAEALNQPVQLESLALGDHFAFVASPSGGHPTLVRDDYRRERPRWRITPCEDCGQSELFDPPSKLLALLNPTASNHPEAAHILFNQRCPACGQGVLVVSGPARS